ncbi:protein phosphatase 2C domain-containing protein [Streptomyces sp. PSKA54]|uniref:Protein phosphatase 2C domain-containing protein n=1 Tax=Streptomyces himalayensis subsp. aureolus TaxID=2758039 RepID=A0A7W2CZ58_9ACTN|nr:protein phosphatase 2C domain-containing protein [Streptomyces himalayensis]MBA4861671.1 protein phosphatase 2C domain-containing protein [Streptomyces himalayensis subsp. aureolus]
MSHQGERHTGHEDDWWGQLYDDSTEDTGPTAAADTLEDRFASAAGTVGSGPSRASAAPGAMPDPREPADEVRPPADSAGWPDAGPGARWPVSGTGGVAGRPVGGTGGAAGRPVGGTGGGAGRPVDGTGEGAEQPVSGTGRWRAPWEVPAGDGGPRTLPPTSNSAAASAASAADAASVSGARVPDERPEPGPAQPSSPHAGSPWLPHQPSPREASAAPRDASAPPGEASAPPTEAPVPPGEAPTAPGEASAAPGEALAPPPEAFAAGRRDASAAGRDVSEADHEVSASGRRDASAALHEAASAAGPESAAVSPAEPPPTVLHVGDGPPTYEAEPTALPPADPDDLDDLVADTVLDGARYGSCTLRAASVRGDSARFRGEPRRDSLLTARFGTGSSALVLVAMATGARATPGAHRAAAEACHWIGRAVGRSHVRLAEDIRAARRGDLKSGLHRLTDRSLGKLRASAAELGVQPEEYAATLRCLLLPADPECRTRVFFGVGAGGLFRLRDGEWQDIEPRVAEAETTGAAVVGFGSLPPGTSADAPHETPDGDRLTMDLGITTPPTPYDTPPEPTREPFRFRASVARPGDTLLLCTGGLAEPLRGEPGLVEHLKARWADGDPPGLAAFLADTQVRVKGYADDRTAAAVWEA